MDKIPEITLIYDGENKVTISLSGHCTGDELIDAFKAFMLAIGYHPCTVSEFLDDEETRNELAEMIGAENDDEANLNTELSAIKSGPYSAIVCGNCNMPYIECECWEPEGPLGHDEKYAAVSPEQHPELHPVELLKAENARLNARIAELESYIDCLQYEQHKP